MIAARQFKTHLNENISGDRLMKAENSVADFYVNNANAIRLEDAYESHITEQMKDDILKKSLEDAEKIRNGTMPMGFWLWQRINTELTGECVAFLPKVVGKT